MIHNVGNLLEVVESDRVSLDFFRICLRDDPRHLDADFVGVGGDCSLEVQLFVKETESLLVGRHGP